MRYSQLRAFHHVAATGGFSNAARHLNQTQPSLSELVRKLEQAHDVLLFHREGRSVRLTEAGEALFRRTRQFFDLEDGIRQFLAQSRSEVTGTLRIVADSALHVMPAIGRFRVAYPKVFVALQSGNTEEVLRELRGYHAEIGVVGNPPAAPDLDAVDLGRSPIIAIAAKGLLPHGTGSLRLADLPNWPLIAREKGSRTRASLEQAAHDKGVTLTPMIEVDGREALREVVASGAGLGFVSEAEFGHDSRLVRVPISDLDVDMKETVVSMSTRRDVPVIRAFLSVLAEVTGRESTGKS